MVSSAGFLASTWLFVTGAVAAPSSAATTAPPAQFTVPNSVNYGANLIANIDDATAVNAQKVCPGYTASNVQKTEFGITATLKLAGAACNVYGTDVQYLNLTVEHQSADRLNINIVPTHIDASNQSWYLLPQNIVPKPTVEPATVGAHSDLTFNWSNEPSFSFKVTRKTTGDTLFNTEGTVLVFEDQFIEFVSSLPENYNLYGLGEHIHSLRLGNNYTVTTYAADVGDPIDQNIYGTHPFYLDTRYYEVDGKNYKLLTTDETHNSKKYKSFSHGVFLRNAHGQEVLLRPNNLTWRTIGGSVDLYFYSGPSQPEITKNYQQSTVGLPAMQQYFAFGYHQCRWGYNNWTEMQEVVTNFKNFEIPLETIWSDIDYMNQYRDFDNDQVRFSYGEAARFLGQLHQDGQHYVPIVDAAIYVPNPEDASDAYPPYNRAGDIWLKNPDGSQYIGAVWPGYTVFPDWHNPNSSDWWASELMLWHQNVSFDGIWLDMNEVSSFCVGSCGTGNLTLNPVHPPFQLPGEPGNIIYDYPESFNVTNATEAASASAASSSQAASATSGPTPTYTGYLKTTPTPGVRNVNYPPYVINHVQNGHDLAVHAVSPNATHADGVQEYDVHNLYGYQQTNATYNSLMEIFPGKRPFIIARSTFAGSGKWAGHWGGDNASKWAYMFFSIPQALSFSLFGVPMFGVDTCGFNGNTDEELCSRWMQLSAFFPFYRNHNVLSAIPQEPYRWASVADASKSAMKIRYAILPYIYTLFHLASTKGSTVMRALSWEFPNDPSLAAVETQFLLGPSLMIVPVLEPQANVTKGVFPGVGTGEVWYDWYSQTAFDAKPGVNTTIKAPLGHIPVFVRGGSVLPMQQPALTTRDVRNSPWSLLVALSGQGTAFGQLYVDDGESITPDATLNVDFAASHSTLTASMNGSWKETNSLANVTVLGVQKTPSSVTLNGKPVSKSSVSYNATSQVLLVNGLQDLTSAGAWSSDWTLKW
ncbi:putative alpha-glucosidase AgdA [Talaromyces proteolyticus]|uniref:Alpha-glucosidase n=1 Tax=Talaromyces proteolyticus TaxID=1131652 RepID=A0AAD4KFI6_9EURO|nr:putative alpha-glucosidase AgdA [Talaromyces proteolyticus]KAH8690762.1 putative alpha-glucosidase AgdA [Talaromyces proteolyticus]